MTLADYIAAVGLATIAVGAMVQDRGAVVIGVCVLAVAGAIALFEGNGRPRF